MKKFEVGNKIMGISTDVFGNRIISGNIIDIIEFDPVIRKPEKLIVDEGIIDGRDIIDTIEAVEYNGFKHMQAKIFYEEAEKLEKKAKKLREMARHEIYSEGTK